MKQLNCADVVPGCTFVRRREGDDELWVKSHRTPVTPTGWARFPPEVAETIRDKITEVCV